MIQINTQHCTFFFLHGFLADPSSILARFFREQFDELGIQCKTPDFNKPNFINLTLGRQIKQVNELLPSGPVILIGHSLGGLTSVWVAEMNLNIERLVLLAPSFEFCRYWLPRLSPQQLEEWRVHGTTEVFHGAYNCVKALSYEFIHGFVPYSEHTLKRRVPTLILHGVGDGVIPVQASRDFAASRSEVTLQELQSDHELINVKEEVWQAINRFCGLDSVKLHKMKKIVKGKA